MLFPDKTCILGDRSLGLKTVHIADFSNDTGRVDLANAGNKSHGSNTNGHSLVYRMICGEGQAIGVLAAAWMLWLSRMGRRNYGLSRQCKR